MFLSFLSQQALKSRLFPLYTLSCRHWFERSLGIRVKVGGVEFGRGDLAYCFNANVKQ